MKKFFTIIFFVLIINVNAQSLQRQTIASIGAYTLDNGTLIRQTIGQSYGTTSDYSNDIRFNPGFQQPLFRVETIHSTININISVFPNPATNQVTIKSSNVLKNVMLQIISINGQQLMDEKINEFNSYTINCDSWASGVYLITLSSDKNLYSSKLIISK